MSFAGQIHPLPFSPAANINGGRNVRMAEWNLAGRHLVSLSTWYMLTAVYNPFGMMGKTWWYQKTLTLSECLKFHKADFLYFCHCTCLQLVLNFVNSLYIVILQAFKMFCL